MCVSILLGTILILHCWKCSDVTYTLRAGIYLGIISSPIDNNLFLSGKFSLPQRYTSLQYCNARYYRAGEVINAPGP